MLWPLLSVFCLGSLALGKPAAMLGGCSSSPMDGSTCWGTEASGQQPPYKWATLNADWLAQVQTAWLWPHETLSRVMQPICSQMTDPQKLCEIRNAYCSFQYLSFRVICFGALLFFILLWLAKLNHLWVIVMHAKIFENHWARTFIHSPNNCCLYLLYASQRAETQWWTKQTLPDLDVSCFFPSLHLPQFISFIYVHVPMLCLLLLHWQFRRDLCLVSSLPYPWGWPCAWHTGGAQLICTPWVTFSSIFTAFLLCNEFRPQKQSSKQYQ